MSFTSQIPNDWESLSKETRRAEIAMQQAMENLQRTHAEATITGAEEATKRVQRIFTYT